MQAAMKEQIGQLLIPFLNPFQAVYGLALTGVWRSGGDHIASLSLGFGGKFLSFQVDADDDTVKLELCEIIPSDYECVSEYYPWKQHLGNTLEWGWVGFNQQGYLDAVSISLNGVAPTFTLTAAASTLHISEHRALHDIPVSDQGAAHTPTLAA